jgi:hypothetical protein
MERETGFEPATSSLGIQTYVGSKSLARFCCEFLNLQRLAESAFSKFDAQSRHKRDTGFPTVWTGRDLLAFTKAPFRELPFEGSKTLPGSPEVIPGSSGWHRANPGAQRSAATSVAP